MKKQNFSLTFFSSIQWFFFLFANTVVVPISIGSAFQLDPSTVEMMLRSSFMLTGVACIFQGVFGHRFPLMEGPSGLTWGVMLNLGLASSTMGMSLTDIGGGIVTGTLLACAVAFLFAIFNGIQFLQSIFTPIVLSVYLFLLSFQLAFIFFKGMLQINDAGTMNVAISLYSLALVVLVSILKIKGNKIVSNFSILIGLVVGWIGYAVLFSDQLQQVSHSSGFAFALFPLGKPNLEIGIIAVTFIAGLVNLTNTMASIQAGANLFQEKPTNKQYRNSIGISSIFTAIGTTLGLVSYTPFTSSIGFLQSTRIFDRKPFLLGGGILVIIGLVPLFGSFLVTMPVTVGNAVLFVAYLQLFGTAFDSLKGATFNSSTIFRLAAPIMIGLSLMNCPQAVFNSLPILVQPFLSNGLITGVIIAIILEKVVNWSKYETPANQELKNAN
ncbi:MAG: uracil/xanthine transporter [Bacillaceae bacterium]